VPSCPQSKRLRHKPRRLQPLETLLEQPMMPTVDGDGGLMASKKANIKNEKQYEKLKEKGMSKQRAAKIANSPGASKRGGKKASSSGAKKTTKSQGGTTAQKKAAGRRGGKKSGAKK
jgi:hypothetical protein